MGIDTAKVTAATAVLNADILSGTTLDIKGYERLLTGIGYTGSTAIGDTAVEFFVDDISIGTVYNSKLLAGNKDDIQDIQPRLVPAGTKLKAVVRDAAVANPVFVMLNTVTA